MIMPFYATHKENSIDAQKPTTPAP